MSTTGSSTRSNMVAGAAALIVMALAFFVFSATSDDDGVVAVDAKSTQVSDDSSESSAEGALFDDGDDTAAEQSDTAPPDAAESTATTIVETVEAAAQFSDLPTITVDELPIEAIDTLFLIADGGPYPYQQDDGTFQNREGILPDRSSQHYREYTVDTPGASNRGARRIVSGADGERYYTDDHYDSFREIIG